MGNNKKTKIDWHTLTLKEVLAKTKSNLEGLNDQEVQKRLLLFGPNRLPEEKLPSKLKILLSQFNNPLIFILLIAIIISTFLKHYTDSIFIVGVLLVNCLVGFYQENKVNRSLFLLRKMVKIKARVYRDGHLKEIDSEKLVPGDVILLRSGDKVPADAYLIEAKNLKINEASLTGEWRAVKKEVKSKLPLRTPLAERINLVFLGTVVEEGWAKALVVATGLETELGQIASFLKTVKEKKTPLQKKFLTLSKLVGIFILFIVSLIVLIGYLEKQPFGEVFLASLALAVSAIPEGLLPAVTVVLVLAMRRILKNQGLVRKVLSAETLGGVTVICTDKTGTLTEGKMQVSHILTSSRELLSDHLKTSVQEEKNDLASHLTALKIAALATEAFVENPESTLEEWVVRGRPTEKALLLAAQQAGLNKYDLEKEYPLIDRLSFESNYKFSASYHQFNKDENILYVVGAPEELIKRSTFLDVDGKRELIKTKKAEELIKKSEEFAIKGLRVLACAYKILPRRTVYQNLLDLTQDLVLVGFITLKDPLRKDAKEAIKICHEAGIKVVIVTGDHKLTSKTIAEELGFSLEEENILEGKDLEEISQEKLEEIIEKILIFARVSPHHKLRIVKAFQARGEVVAMFGDGVNDAPALKAADVGVVVGSGTEIAKEVGDLILLDDNFQTVVKAIEQGRIAFENVRKIFTYLVADDFSEIFLFLAAMIVRLPLPLLPVQILWINLIEDGFPDIALTTEEESQGIMKEPPRSPREPILNKPLKIWMASIFVISGLAAFLVFLFSWLSTADLIKARTITFSLIALDSLTFVFSTRSFKRSIFRKDIFANRYLTGAVLISLGFLFAGLYFPFFQKILQTQPLTLNNWLAIIFVSLIEIILIDFLKIKIFRHYGFQKN